MSEENVEIALRQIEAFNRRDVDAVLALVSPEVEWEDSMFWSEGPRIYRGRAELQEWLTNVLELWETIHVEADEIAETRDGRVFARLFLRGRGKASGAEAELDAGRCSGSRMDSARRRVFRDRAEALERAAAPIANLAAFDCICVLLRSSQGERTAGRLPVRCALSVAQETERWWALGERASNQLAAPRHQRQVRSARRCAARGTQLRTPTTPAD